MIGVVSCVNGTGVSMYNGLVSNSNSCSANNIKVVVENTVSGTGNNSNWNIYNYTQTGLSICNATPDSSTSSQASTAAPRMRVAQGNFSLWAANERWQCYWREDSRSPGEDTSSLGGTLTNGNRAALSGIWGSSLGPNKTTTSAGRIANGLGSYDYNVRVEACVSSALGEEKCAKYPGGNYKPIGLLQYYGESGQLKFGMMTGSYAKNKSGGVLRKNISNISDEINVTTDGTFKTTLPTTGSIIKTIGFMRVWGYDYADGRYGKDSVAGNAFCSWGLTTLTEGTCLNWGNPMSEVYLESLRYLAGKTANSNFHVANDVLLPASPTWTDPLTTQNYCAPLNVLVFNSASNSYEIDNQFGGASDLGVTGNTADATVATNLVGTLEGINGQSWFVGNNGAGSSPADLCSVKSVANLADPFGMCPEGAGTEGSYKMAGLAFFAHTNRIRNPAPLSVPASDSRSLKVSTYGIALATNTPKTTVMVNNVPVTIIPQGRLDNSGFGSGGLVDWKIVCAIPLGASGATVSAIAKVSAGRCTTTGTGAFYWNGEDSEQGGDYDQDMWGRLQYEVSGSTIKVTTDVVAESTPFAFGFGYAISGTDKDGPHFHSGIEGFTHPAAADPSGVTRCNNCNVGDAATSWTYNVSATASAPVLKDPLWYAAKFGGFKDRPVDPTDPANVVGEPNIGVVEGANDGITTKPNEWDVRNQDGSTTGCTDTGCDGNPDKFFLVTNPNYLENALDKAFVDMLSASSASSVATNSTSLQTGSRIYQARFNANEWSGQLRALDLNPVTGAVIEPEVWDGGQTINSLNNISATNPSGTDSRTIITYGVDTAIKQGIPFTWTALTAQTPGTTQRDALNSNGLGVADPVASPAGSKRLDYLRGSQLLEGKSAASFRTRPNSRLGDIVSSSPTYVSAPEAGWSGSAYLAFRQAGLSRTPMIYTGANDGMLHAFRVSDGREMLAYVPSVFYNNNAASSNLSQLANQNYSHKYFVDGTPMVNDVESGSAWKTVLVGGLNWGGRAYYALDITNPDGLTTAALGGATGGPLLAFSQANAANLVMWEFTSANDSDLGYSFVQPTYPSFKGIAQQIVKMRNGRWAAVVGNGYNSTGGKAALFIFFLDRAKVGGLYSNTWTIGTDYIKLVADMQIPGNDNGLSTPQPFSARGDGIADWIYAGDLKGNLWKFDVTDVNPANWKVAYNVGPCTSTTAASTCTPLFTARDSSSNRQPITTAPQVIRHPNGGVVVLFGTGKYLENSDTLSPFTTQTYYGVWDNGSNTAANTARANLLEQKVASVVSVTNAAGDINDFRVTTDYCVVAGSISGKDVANNNAVIAACDDDWSKPAAKKGWYMDLPTSGERSAYNGILRNERIVFPTLIPSATPCLSGGDSWMMELDALTGRRLASTPFDVNGDGVFSSADLLTYNSLLFAAGGVKPGGGGITTTPTVIKAQNDKSKEYKYSSSSTGAVIKTTESVTQGQAGRITWREIPQ